jgi:hypothetical protein
VSPTWLPARGEIFGDDRGGHRTLRLSWHHDEGLVVLSLWRGGLCTGTFRLPVQDVPALIEVLRRGLDAGYEQALGQLGAEPGAADPPSVEPAAG